MDRDGGMPESSSVAYSARGSRRQRVLAVAVWLPGMWACAGAEAERVTVADSAGVRIVEYADLGSVDPPTTREVTLESRFGGSDAPEGEELAYLLGFVPLIDNHLFVADPTSADVRRFDLAGGVAAVLGGRGEGPGEFLYPALAGTLGGDSIVVYDSRQRRVSIFGAGGTFHRSFLVPDEVGPFTIAAGMLDDGAVVFTGRGGLTLRGYERLVRDTVPITVVDRNGALVASFGRNRRPGLFEGPPDISPRALAIPFMPGDLVATGPSWIHVALEDRAEVRRFDRAGSLVSILRVGAPPIRVTDAEVDSIRDADVEDSAARFAAGIRTLYSRMPIPEWKPPVDQMIVDPGGRLWLSFTGDSIGSAARWLVFEPDGSPMASVRVPRGRMVGVSADRVILLTHDEYGTPIIGVYRLGG